MARRPALCFEFYKCDGGTSYLNSPVHLFDGGEEIRVAEMTRPASLSPLGSEFDGFLFAPIGEDRNGTLVSVLSALARQDVDPWEEAAELARLPRESGILRLASLIAALSDRPSVHLDPGTIATRLIALLPLRASSNIPPRFALLDVGAWTNSQSVLPVIILNVVFFAFVLGAQCILANHRAPAQVDNAHLPASTVSQQTPPPSSGQ